MAAKISLFAEPVKQVRISKVLSCRIIRFAV
jgi:hypothetical protein